MPHSLLPASFHLLLNCRSLTGHAEFLVLQSKKYLPPFLVCEFEWLSVSTCQSCDWLVTSWRCQLGLAPATLQQDVEDKEWMDGYLLQIMVCSSCVKHASLHFFRSCVATPLLLCYHAHTRLMRWTCFMMQAADPPQYGLRSVEIFIRFLRCFQHCAQYVMIKSHMLESHKQREWRCCC